MLTLARWEFALTASLHFVVVATTLGLAPIAAALQTAVWRRARRTRRPGGLSPSAALVEARDRVIRLYLINYGAGIITGIVMEVQMGLNWSGHASALYDPIATALAVETLGAFFLESTLLGLYLLTPGRVGEGWRAVMLWGVALTAWISAWVVVAANAFLHHPIGVEGIGTAGARFTDFWVVLTQPAAVVPLMHILGAAGLVAGSWLLAAGARLTLRPSAGSPAPATVLLRIGVWLVAIASVWTLGTGFAQFAVVRDQAFTRNGPEGIALALMMLNGLLFLLLAWVVLVPLLLGRALPRVPPVLWLLVIAPWFPLATTILGWVYREEARQPWFIVGEVRVTEALSATSAPALVVTSTAFVALGAAVVVFAWRLMVRELGRPAAVVSGPPMVAAPRASEVGTWPL